MLTGRLDAAINMASPEFVAHNIAGETLDLADFRKEVRTLAARPYNYGLTIENQLAEGNLVYIQWAANGITPWGVESPEVLRCFSLLRMENGQVAEL